MLHAVAHYEKSRGDNLMISAGTEQIASCGVLSASYRPAGPHQGENLALANHAAVLVPGPSARFQLQATAPGRRYAGELDSPAVGVLPPCALVQVEEASAGSLLVLYLDSDFLRAAAGGGAVRGCPQVMDPWLSRIGATMLAGFRAGRPPTEGFMVSVAHQMRAHLHCHYRRAVRRHSPSALGNERLQRALHFMRSHYDDKDLDVGRIAASVGLSPFHFTRMFTAAVGKAPHAHLTALRMEEARRLLAGTCLPIATIAQRVGYATHAHFTGSFGRHVGIPPAQYRTEARAARAAERQRAANPR